MTEGAIRVERTRGDARKSCRIFAADSQIFDRLSFAAFGWYMRFLMSAAENQSDKTDFNNEEFAMICEQGRAVLQDLMCYGLVDIDLESGKIVISNMHQRLNLKDKQRKARHRERVYMKELSEVIKSVNRNDKPHGVPEWAVVWGGNHKRWGGLEDLKLALAIHRHVSKHVDQFAFGITLINQCRILRQSVDVTAGDAVHLHACINRVIKSGVKLTINNMRQELSKAGL